MAIHTVSGVISNEHEDSFIEISSGDNLFNLAEGEYQDSIRMDGNHIPWAKEDFSRFR